MVKRHHSSPYRHSHWYVYIGMKGYHNEEICNLTSQYISKCGIAFEICCKMFKKGRLLFEAQIHQNRKT